ncbi:MAG TPA: hypothetical protein PKL44_00190 [Candidatus Dojkabacteria bacterium]|nr:hypothetical protein [Candidatus Dojkabacteria bacterium]
MEDKKLYWESIQSNFKEDHRRYLDEETIRRMNSGMDFIKAKDLIKLDSKKNPRRFDPDKKRHNPTSDFNFDYKLERLSPQLKAEILEKRERAAQNAGSGHRRGPSLETIIKREMMKKRLVAAGIDDATAEKMSKTIK